MSSIKINSNIAALNAQRNLYVATNRLSDSFTRLSSGLRINKASDDAAGLSISESLKSETKIFNQGVRNLNDGLSLLSIADGALGELSNITVRLNELAEQSSNGTLGNKQRIALDKEAQALSKEYNRIARSTEFNGRKLFDGDFGDLSLAAGGSIGALITDGLGGAINDGTFNANISVVWDSSPREVELFDIDNDGNLDLFTANSGSGGLSVAIGNGDGTFKNRVTYVSGAIITGIKLSDFNNDGQIDVALADQTSNSISILLGNASATFNSPSTFSSVGVQDLTVSDVNNDGIEDIISTNFSLDVVQVYIGNSNGSFRSAVSYVTNDTRDIKSMDIDGDGVNDLIVADLNAIGVLKGNSDGTFKARVTYVNNSTFGVSLGDVNGDDILDVLTAAGAGSATSIFLGNADGTFNARTSYAMGGLWPSSSRLIDFNGDGSLDILTSNDAGNSVSVAIGNGNGSFNRGVTYAITNSGLGLDSGDINNDGALDVITGSGGATINILLGNYNEGVAALQTFSLKTQIDSRDSLSYLKKVLTKIGEQRGHIGAFQSRVEFATNNLQQGSLAYSEANSRITDTDIAEESSKLVANSILQNAATSILVQANQQPEIVLQMLSNI